MQPYGTVKHTAKITPRSRVSSSLCALPRVCGSVVARSLSRAPTR